MAKAESPRRGDAASRVAASLLSGLEVIVMPVDVMQTLRLSAERDGITTGEALSRAIADYAKREK